MDARNLKKFIVRRQEVAYLIVEANSPEDAEAKTYDEAFDEYDHTYDVTWTEELVKCPKGQAAADVVPDLPAADPDYLPHGDSCPAD